MLRVPIDIVIIGETLASRVGVVNVDIFARFTVVESSAAPDAVSLNALSSVTPDAVALVLIFGLLFVFIFIIKIKEGVSWLASGQR